MRKQGVILLVWALALAAPGAAAAKIDAQDVKQATVTFADIPVVDVAGVDPGTGGGYWSCPGGTKTITGGAYLYPTGGVEKPTAAIFTNVTSSSVTGDGKGWYADATNATPTPMTLRIFIRCIAEGKLADATISSDTASLANGETDSVKAKCPQGRRAFTGGSFWHAPGLGPEHANANDVWTSSSTPTGDAGAWYGDGYAFTSIELSAYAWCLPANQLTDYTKQTAERSIGSLSDKVKRGACPRSHPAAAAAGVLFHKPGQGPKPSNADDAHLSGAGVLDGSSRGFFAAGRNIDMANARLTARAFCLAK